MGFREFITNRLFRNKLQADLDDFHNMKPPANPSRRYIDKLVERLLNDTHATASHRELEMIGTAAVPSLTVAVRDPRYQEEVKRSHVGTAQPLDIVLELLVPHSPEEVMTAATPLIRSSSSSMRKTAAIHLASLGCDDAVPFLADLLNDQDGYVRSYVALGIERALSAGRCSEGFRRSMYELLLNQCDQKWTVALNDVAGVVVALDVARAAIDFASGRWLSSSNPCVNNILEECNKAGILLPEALVRRLLDHSLPLAVGEKCYPHQYVVAGAIEALALTAGDSVKPLLESLLNSEQGEIQESAAKALARLAGLKDPVNFVLEQEETVGFVGLTAPQRIVYCGFIFDTEVCNGGIMQFFGNSGEHAVDTLEALRTLGSPEAFQALDAAMSLVGPLSREPDRDMRLAALKDRYDDLQAAFKPLEAAYYRTTSLLRQRILQYAAANAEHFRSEPPAKEEN
jgi:HEAT repeat protein